MEHVLDGDDELFGRDRRSAERSHFGLNDLTKLGAFLRVGRPARSPRGGFLPQHGGPLACSVYPDGERREVREGALVANADLHQPVDLLEAIACGARAVARCRYSRYSGRPLSLTRR